VHLYKNKTLTSIKLTMVVGLWKKIKEGFKKAGTWIKNAAVKVYDKVIKPVGKFIGGVVAPAVSKVATSIAPALSSFNPEYGAIAAGVATGAETLQRVVQNPRDELIPLLKKRR
jgi:hypothetical protein